MHQVIHGRGPGGPVPISIQGQSAGRPGLGAGDPRRSRAGSPARAPPAAPRRSQGTQLGRSSSSFFPAYHQRDPRNPRREPLRQARKSTRESGGDRGSLGLGSTGARGRAAWGGRQAGKRDAGEKRRGTAAAAGYRFSESQFRARATARSTSGPTIRP